MWVKECCKAQPSILLQRSPNSLRPFLPLIGLRFLETCGPTWYPPRSLERKCWIFSVWKQPAGTCCAVSFFHESCFHYITVETVRCLVCTSHCLLYFLHLTTCLQSWGEGGGVLKELHASGRSAVREWKWRYTGHFNQRSSGAQLNHFWTSAFTGWLF